MKRKGINIVGGWLSVESVYQKQGEKLAIANPCWVSWDTSRGRWDGVTYFQGYLREKQAKGIDYVIGAAHKRYTLRYWEHFLRGSGFSFGILGEYELLMFSGGSGGKMVLRGEVKKVRENDVKACGLSFSQTGRYVPCFDLYRWRKELVSPGASETWVYEVDGESVGWISGWWYTYLQKDQRKRGFLVRWIVLSGLGYQERTGFLKRVFGYYQEKGVQVMIPDFVSPREWLLEAGCLLSGESYAVFFVDLQGKGEIHLYDFDGFFVF